jgi:hypothetical protein
VKFFKWCQTINELHFSDEAVFTINDIKNIIAEKKQKQKQKFIEGRLRQSITTPKPECDMRGDEVELMLKNWGMDWMNENMIYGMDRSLHKQMTLSEDHKKLMKMYKLPQRPTPPNPDDYKT